MTVYTHTHIYIERNNTMNKPSLLISSKLIEAVNRLSIPQTYNTRVLIRYGERVDFKTRNYTVSDMVAVIPAIKRKSVLKRFGIPGYLYMMWTMDYPVTEYWRPRVESLGEYMGISNKYVFNRY